ncbi:hypothetical protein ONZ43_g7454 [Nemania bipapillata]|uniref:Uncharacterized protein n=1 Tax=Nemania bipapillata TaxID=110536 RepID=A0ACC2HR91_9PEZI|nr:hypothetical protein ONZ43_g7454 [Nemania bipapillata]
MKDSPTPHGQGQGQGKGKGKGQAKANTLSAYTLHSVATILLLSQMLQPAGHLALHILHTLTKLGYAPSILTLVMLGFQRRWLDQPAFEPALEGLERILRRIDSDSGGSNVNLAADACTMRAMIYAQGKTDEGDTNALRWFRRR